MKKKIFLYYLVLIIIGVSVTGLFTTQLVQRFYKNEVEEKLKSTATLIEYQVSDNISKNIKVNYNAVAQKYAELLDHSAKSKIPIDKINTRITFINFNGKVLGESQYDYLEMENHLNRKEIQEAMKGKIGEDMRFSKTLKVNFLYIAMPLRSEKVVLRVSVPLIQLEKIDVIIWHYTVIGIFVGLFLTTLLALKFSSYITKPVNQLSSAAREISNGKYSKRVNTKSKDELGQLADTFNDMAEKLEKTVAELTDKNAKVNLIINSMIGGIVAVDNNMKVILINDIAKGMFEIENTHDVIGCNIIEIIRNSQINSYLEQTISDNISLINEVVIRTNEGKVLNIYTNPIISSESPNSNTGGIVFLQDITSIRKLEHIRTEFVSNVTHELKTPLTSIRGFIETLRSGAIDDRNVADKFLEIIDIEAERLYMLINDILHLSEIETKQKDTNVGIYSLKPIAEEVISILQSSADKKSITLKLDVDENLSIEANKDRIKQMFINLIDNGIKYNSKNGSVIIRGFKSEGMVVISVKDSGIGIAPEHLARIFERFYRVDKGRSRSMGGTGLGLSIVKHIVSLYNGDVRVYSQLGEGTEFIIQFPS
jgi:two-component system, OmpR family, phosphate regulon sensor histidine kinase PhoR